MYYAHLENDTNLKTWRDLKVKIDTVIQYDCFDELPIFTTVLTDLSKEIGWLLDFVKNKYSTISWANSVYFFSTMVLTIGIVFYFFADQRNRNYANA